MKVVHGQIMNNKFNGSSIAALSVLMCMGSISAYIIYSLVNEKKREKNESNILELIQRRRSVFPKQYTSEPVSQAIIDAMLEGARWAPTHHLQEPWYFVVFASAKSRKELGEFLANDYRNTSTKLGKFSQKKFDKKLKNAEAASHIIAICVHRTDSSKCPEVEDICAVSMAVQNMKLIATEHGVGSYWSSASVHENKKDRAVKNPISLKKFLDLPFHSICIGWLFVGNCDAKCFKKSQRKNISDKVSFR